MNPRTILRYAAVVVAALAAAAQADGPAIPETHAGRIAAAYVKAFNTGDAEVVREFETKHRAASSLRARSMEDRLEQYRGLYNQWRKLEFRRVLQSEEFSLLLLVHAELGDEWFHFQFVLEADPPHGLEGIKITGGVGSGESADEKPIDAETRERVVSRIADRLLENYVYPEVAAKMADMVHKNLADGRYDGFTNTFAFAERLTADLREICHDKHLAVRVRTPRRGGGGRLGSPRGAEDNSGFVKVEILPGNIGYVRLDGFIPGREAEVTAAAAMAFVANTDALIFDLRQNGGGSPDMIAFLSGYLFDESVHLNSFYNRPTDSRSETWSRADVPGKRFGQQTPVYVLTSHYTFSGAEEFTYNLKHLKRATIIGETTGGGAHPVGPQPVNRNFTIAVPYARAINPITKTNWEGVGVIPHIKVSADEALDTAHKLSLEAVKATRSGN